MLSSRMTSYGINFKRKLGHSRKRYQNELWHLILREVLNNSMFFLIFAHSSRTLPPVFLQVYLYFYIDTDELSEELEMIFLVQPDGLAISSKITSKF